LLESTRNGHRPTLRIAHQLAEPTAAALTGLADPSALAAMCDPNSLQAVPSGFTLPPDTPPAVTAAIL
jgi:hypothetical protein